METVPNQEIWQVEANGQVFDANFDQLTSWITDGSVHKMDRVRRSNLRWIEAGKVPTLAKFFNAKDTNEPSPPVVTTSHVENPGSPPTSEFVNAPFENKGSLCAVHVDASARYTCDTCANLFCKACPTSYGSSVKICPLCGAMCKAIEETATPLPAEQSFTRIVNNEPFGFADLGRAFAHPFKFKVSLLLGGLMFTIFTLGQSVTGFGGMFMMFSGLMAGMAANTLSFGIMANTIENFSQGKLNENFMPSFDDFSMWDDVIHPFFLSIGVYVSSFGPLIAVFLVAFSLLAQSSGGGMDGVKSDAVRTVDPGMTYAVNSVKQSERVKEILQKDKEFQQKRLEAMQKAADNGEELNMTRTDYDQEKEFEELANMAQQNQKAQLESAVGKSPETKEQEQAAMVKDILGYGTAFVVAAGLALVWGFFFFPAACAVAGYTRSLGATLNPTVGLDTIRRLGGSYVLILVMAAILAVVSLVLTTVLSGIFAPFNMPGVGNLPAKAIGSFVGFYLSVVFSCILGYALFKAADRLRLPS